MASSKIPPSLSNHLESFFHVEEIKSENIKPENITSGCFFVFTPNYSAIDEFLASDGPLASHLQDFTLDSIHIGDSGKGKSTLIGALQDINSQTAYIMALNQPSIKTLFTILEL